eukprot:TRINITY_DN3961_c0_g2_i1.p1 TRINITY_DN3961_c0_g2~~TRINITY_DN3961_c0_g2_i1.p1  ORF type:complete len:326 (-),score=111.68 TRINITY_DN3961_c0_g2_i1:130-1107(-)
MLHTLAFMLHAVLLPLTSRLALCSLGCFSAALAAAEGSVILIDKFNELKEMVAAQAASGKTDPGMMAQYMDQLAQMEKQIKELQIGQAKYEETKESLQKRTQEEPKVAAKADSAWAASCFAMAVESLGGSLSEEERAALERLAQDDLPAQEASLMPLFRMAAVCLEKRSEDASRALDLLAQVSAAAKHAHQAKADAKKRKKGAAPSQSVEQRPPPMPEEWVELSEQEDAVAKVRELSAETWALMKEQAERATWKPHWTERGPPKVFLLAGIVPAVRLIFYLLEKRKSRQMSAQAEVKDDAEKDKKSTKDKDGQKAADNKENKKEK